MHLPYTASQSQARPAIATQGTLDLDENRLFLVHHIHHGQDSRTNSVLDPDEYLTPVTLQWYQQQLAQLNLPILLVASDFIPRLDNFRVPDYYKSLIHTARVYYGSEEEPRLEPATKPRGGYGWDQCAAVPGRGPSAHGPGRQAFEARPGPWAHEARAIGPRGLRLSQL